VEYDKNNVFARILRKEIPANIVYENDVALAFHDVYPKAPTHILVIPKGEFIAFDDFAAQASAEEIIGFNQAVHHVIQTFSLQEKGYRLLSNQGLHGCQEVPHYHVHILGGKHLGPPLSSS
jgi:diadenosine tetraphosphate (Ap4A) HIT family hydrolase